MYHFQGDSKRVKIVDVVKNHQFFFSFFKLDLLHDLQIVYLKSAKWVDYFTDIPAFRVFSVFLFFTDFARQKNLTDIAWMYLQLPLRQWGVGNVYLLVLSSWKVNIAENPIAVMGL